MNYYDIKYNECLERSSKDLENELNETKNALKIVESDTCIDSLHEAGYCRLDINVIETVLKERGFLQ